MGLACVLGAALVCGRPGAPSKPFTFSILEDYDNGQPLAEIERDFELFQELGIYTWRGSLGWDDYEPEPGRYDLAWLHEFALRAAHHGIDLRPYVAYTPEWAAGGADADGQSWNQPPRDLAQWSSFITALAGELRHHANVRSLEIYNEENVPQWWEGTSTDYARTLIAAASSARASGPFEILLGGLVFPDTEFVEAVCGEGGRGAFDVLPVHAYPETWTPAGVTVEHYLGTAFARGFVKDAERACGPKRIWINETGFATVSGKSEEEQAAWWVRAVATFAATPRVEHVGIYEIRDARPDRPVIGDAPNYHLGLVRADGTRKRAFATVAALMDLFRGGALAIDDRLDVGRSRSPGELFHHLFVRTDGERVLIVWNRTADDRVSIRIPGRIRRMSEVDLDGTVRSIEPVNPLDVRLRRGIPRLFRIVM